MKSILVRRLYQELEEIKQDDVQTLTKVWVFSYNELCNKSDRRIVNTQ